MVVLGISIQNMIQAFPTIQLYNSIWIKTTQKSHSTALYCCWCYRYLIDCIQGYLNINWQRALLKRIEFNDFVIEKCWCCEPQKQPQMFLCLKMRYIIMIQTGHWLLRWWRILDNPQLELYFPLFLFPIFLTEVSCRPQSNTLAHSNWIMKIIISPSLLCIFLFINLIPADENKCEFDGSLQDSEVTRQQEKLYFWFFDVIASLARV